MHLFEISAILLTVSALGSFINHKWIRLPPSIGLLVFAMGLSLLGIILETMGLFSNYYIKIFLSNIDFQDTVFHGMLSFLLFAGALQINIEDLKNAKLPIAITATLSTVISTFLIGSAFYLLANKMGFTQITFLYALLFGSIISPTDPIAVLSIVKKMRASKQIETTILGESLFNDGIAIVLFLTILQLSTTQSSFNLIDVSGFLLLEIGGGILFGGLLGWIAFQMMLRVNDYHTGLFITLAVATGGYALAEYLHISAPLAMVIAGIIIGNHGRTRALSEDAKEHIDSFWEAIDEILNTVLFLLIGLEMMVINLSWPLTLLGMACIGIALLSRLISLATPLALLKPIYKPQRGTVLILTWSGLRGALSIAMVLALKQEQLKEIFLPCIYLIVIFSITVQGLTLSKILKRYNMSIALS